MTYLGVAVAVVESGRILLTEREDFPIWCLPGGRVDDGELVAAAAVREVREEVGLQVELTRLVGIYSWPRWHDGSNHNVLFAARPCGGRLAPDPREVARAAYFSPAQLPHPLHRMWIPAIRDALAGVGGSAARTEPQRWPFPPA